MKSFEDRLEIESAGWVSDGVVTAEQRQRLLARHPAKAGGANRFLAILAAVGGVLLAVGISLVIKSNWERIGDWVKIAGLLALLGGFSYAGWKLKMSPGEWPRIGDACLMVAALCFFLGIVLVSQIFHLDSRPANGVLLWWVGIAALPWITRAKGAQFVSVVAGLVWLGMELEAWDSWLRIDRGTAWNRESEYLLPAAGVLVGLAVTWAGFALRGGKREDFAGLHEKVGLIITCVSLYVLGFAWTVHSWSSWAMPQTRWQAVTVLAALAIVGLAAAWRRSRADLKLLFWFALPAFVPALGHLDSIELRDSGWLFGGCACVALFILNIGMIRAGLATGREGWINLGVAFIALNVITRYFELFGTLLEGGVFFIVTGLLVLGLGYFLERKRRSLVGQVRKEVAS